MQSGANRASTDDHRIGLELLKDKTHRKLVYSQRKGQSKKVKQNKVPLFQYCFIILES